MEQRPAGHVNILFVGQPDNVLLKDVYEALSQDGEWDGYTRQFQTPFEWQWPYGYGRMMSPDGASVSYAPYLFPELSKRWSLESAGKEHAKPLIVYIENNAKEEIVNFPNGATMLGLTGRALSEAEHANVVEAAVRMIMADVCLLEIHQRSNHHMVIQTAQLTLDQWFALGEPQRYCWLPKDPVSASPLWPCVKLGETNQFVLYTGRPSKVTRGNYLVQIHAAPFQFGSMGYHNHEMGYPKAWFGKCPGCETVFVYGQEAEVIRHLNEHHPELITY